MPSALPPLALLPASFGAESDMTGEESSTMILGGVLKYPLSPLAPFGDSRSFARNDLVAVVFTELECNEFVGKGLFFGDCDRSGVLLPDEEVDDRAEGTNFLCRDVENDGEGREAFVL